MMQVFLYKKVIVLFIQVCSICNMAVKTIHNLEEFHEVLQSETRIVLLKASALWCGPCRMIEPYWEELASGDLTKAFAFFEIDVDEAPDVAEYCGVTAMPTFFAYSKGVKLEYVTGANKVKLLEFLNSLLPV